MFNTEENSLDERSPIFASAENAISMLKKKGLIYLNRICTECTGQMSLQYNAKSNTKHSYICLSRSCRKQVNLLNKLKISTPNIPIHNYLFAIFKWLENAYEKDVIRNAKISKKSFTVIKKHLIEWCREKNKAFDIKLGSNGKQIQVDETAVCHGLLPNAPSNMPDDFPGVTWMIGFIEVETNSIILECLVNRSAATFITLFKKNVEIGACVVTDGHRSYPAAVAAIGGQHIIVNHSLGFKTQAGDHTNNIENLWSQIKYEIKRRRGIKSSNFGEFLEEWKMRYRFLKPSTDANLTELFYEIIEFLFKKQ